MRKVIIAEDNAQQRVHLIRRIKGIASSRGIEVEVSSVVYGTDLVKRVTTRDYDLCFTDNRIPGMSGSDAIKTIRSAGQILPIYLVSSDNFDEKELNELGATGYLNKSKIFEGNESELEEAIKRHLGGEQNE